MRDTVIYALYSGDMYGTEQMAIAHLRALGDAASTVILAPEGPVHEAAAALGIRTVVATTKGEVFRETLKIARQCKRLSFLTTSITQAFVGLAVAALSPLTRIRHLNICHGGEEAERSFGKKRLLNRTPVRLVAVSAYCASLLRQFGVPAQRILVLENFLMDERIAQAPRRTKEDSPLQALVACRLVPVKRVDLLVSAIKLEPRLADLMQVRVLGTGPLLEPLRESTQGLGFRFDGFRNDVPEVMAQSDVFVQTWADEPFGLAVVEAMAAGLIVVTPDRGGAAEIVGDERHGLFYAADNAQSLADALLRVAEMSPIARTAMRNAAAAKAMACYSASARRQRLLQVFLGAEVG
jgi:glycosyltransferase involved in cell wall biosynthesis